MKIHLLKLLLFCSFQTNYTLVIASLKFNLLNYKASVTYPKLRCSYTARSYAVKSSYTASRFTFRRLVSNQLILHIQRPSW